MSTDTLTASSGTWTAPGSGSAYNVDVECFGDGAGGATPVNSSTGGKGGGGGAYSKKTISVTPGVGYSYVVGQGGAGAPGGVSYGVDGSNGTGTWFSSSGTVFADYGRGNGTAGSTTNSIGDTKFAGGAGGTSPGGRGGCGGGGGAGDANAGSGGSNSISSTGANGGSGGTTGGGAGGSGGSTDGTGNVGTICGGGGGGAGGGASMSAGGNGARGKIVLTYTASVGGARPNRLSLLGVS